MPRSGVELHGFEKDVNKLIDAYALQAELEQSLSFSTFKRLFKAGGYAYLHQAYPGCEHSSEYTQLLFATALDRLDVFSPTAPPESPLWLMHVDKAQAAAAAQAAASMAPALPAAAATAAATTAAAATAAAAAAAPTVQRPAGAPSGAHASQQGIGGAQQAAAAAMQKPAPHVQQCTIRHTLSQNSLAANNYTHSQGSSYSTGVLPPLQPQQQLPEPLQLHQHRGVLLQQQLQLPQAQQPQQLQQLLAGWVQPQLQPQQQLRAEQLLPCFHQQPTQAGLQQLQGSQLLRPADSTPLQHQQAGHWQQVQQQQLLMQQQPQNPLQAGNLQLQHEQQHPVVVQQQGGVVAGGQMQGMAAPLPPSSHQHEQQGEQQPMPVSSQSLDNAATGPAGVAGAEASAAVLGSFEDELGDEFLNDLLAIFDEADAGGPSCAGDLAGGQLRAAAQEEAAAAAAATAASGPPHAQKAAGGAGTLVPGEPQLQQQQQQQQWVPPPMSVPLAVKAAVVFALHCLFETQLTLPKACIYTSLQHLHQLKDAAAQFTSAGPAGADALAVLQLLLSQQRLLVGQFRRPRQWEPQLPAWLAPPGNRLPDLGLGSAAANRAALRAGGGARAAAVVTAASIARSLRDHKPNQVDPVVHREAVFHIKTALRSLSNFRSLQALCTKYADARRAIFEPLLRIVEPGVAMAQVQQQQRGLQEQQEAAGGCDSQPRQQQKGRKRGICSSFSSSKRSRCESAGAATGIQPAGSGAGPAADAGHAAEACSVVAQKAAAAAATAAAAAAGVPKLFDRNFGSVLAAMAGDEAAHMLLLLDPARDPGQAKQKRKKQQAAREAVAAADDSAGLLARHEAGSGAGSRGRKHRKRRLGGQGAAASAADALAEQQGDIGYVQELCNAGIISAHELQDIAQESLDSQGSVQGLGAASQVLQLQRQRRQHTLMMAQQWFKSHDAMMQLGDSDEGEDMP